MNNYSHTSLHEVNQVKLKRDALVVILAVLSIIIAFIAIKTGNVILMIGFVALPFILMLMYRPDVAFILATMLDATRMQVPGVSYTTLGLLAKVIVIGSAFLALMLGQRHVNKMEVKERNPLKWFVFIIISLMIFRGSGLRMLGSETWGGMVYIVMLSGIAYFHAIQGLTITSKQFRTLLWGALLAGFIGTLTSRSGFMTEVAIGQVSGINQARLNWLQPLAYAAFPLVFAIKWKKWVSPIVWLLCVGIIGLTGFRSKLIGFVAITMIYGFFRTRSRVKYCVLTALTVLVAWVSIILVAQYLPLGMQRAISFAPGVEVSHEASFNAEGSVDWRVEIWKYCLEQSPQYLVLGRGSTFNARETAAGLAQHDIATFSPWFAFETRSYHSGPLTLLVDYGLAGLIVGLWLTFVILRRFLQAANWLGKNDTFESRYTLYFISQLIWLWPAFFLVYGDAPGLSKLIANTAVAIVLITSAKILVDKGQQQVLVIADLIPQSEEKSENRSGVPSQ